MASAFNVNIVIKAIDQASSVIRGITKSTKGLEKARARSQKMFSSAANMRQAAEGVSVFARAMRNVVGGTISEYEDFQQAMANVRSKTKLTEDQFAALSAQARELGKGTTFTAVQAAQAMEYMAQAGFDANQIMSAVPTTLNLAAAAGTELGRTSDILTDVMGQFGKEAKDSTYVADLMTRTFTGSNTTLETLFETMKMAGPQFKQLGVGMEEAFAFTGIIGSAGLKGSMAGTALRSMLRGMTGARGPARKAFKDLDVETTTDTGDLRHPLVILDEIKRKMEGLGNVKQANILGKIFGLRGTTGSAVLLESIRSGNMFKMLDQVHDTSITAASVAATRLDTAAGATKRLESATSDLNIELGEKLEPTLTSIKETLIELTSSITGLAQEWPTFTKVVMISAGALTVLLTALAGLLFLFATLVSGFAVWVLAPIAMAKALAALTWVVSGLSTVFAALSASLLPVAAPILAVTLLITGLTLAIITLRENWDRLNMGEMFDGIKDMFKEDGAWAVFKQMFDATTLFDQLTGPSGGDDGGEPDEILSLPALAGAGGGGMNGTLKIQVDGDARVTEAEMTGGDMEINSGPYWDSNT